MKSRRIFREVGRSSGVWRPGPSARAPIGAPAEDDRVPGMSRRRLQGQDAGDPAGTLQLDEPEFIRQLQSGKTEAIGRVVERYLPEIVRAALGLGLDAHGAEDVAQETFATFIQVLPRFEGRSKVRTFLFGIFYRKVKEFWRAIGGNRETDNIDEVMDGRFKANGSWAKPPIPVDLGLHRQDIRVSIDSCLEIVPTQQRMAFVLREVEENSTEEICKIMDISRTNLGVLLFRARNRLRECLEVSMTGET